MVNETGAAGNLMHFLIEPDVRTHAATRLPEAAAPAVRPELAPTPGGIAFAENFQALFAAGSEEGSAIRFSVSPEEPPALFFTGLMSPELRAEDIAGDVPKDTPAPESESEAGAPEGLLVSTEPAEPDRAPITAGAPQSEVAPASAAQDTDTESVERLAAAPANVAASPADLSAQAPPAEAASLIRPAAAQTALSGQAARPKPVAAAAEAEQMSETPVASMTTASARAPDGAGKPEAREIPQPTLKAGAESREPSGIAPISAAAAEEAPAQSGTATSASETAPARNETASPASTPAQPAAGLAMAPGQATAPAASFAPAAPAAPAAQTVLVALPTEIPNIVARASQDPAGERITVQLDPPELGRVSIDFRFDGQTLQHVTVTAETPEAVRQLRQMHGELLEALERNGLGEKDMTFQQQTPQDRQQPPFAGQPPSAAEPRAPATGPAPATTPASNSLTGLLPGRLDIKL